METKICARCKVRLPADNFSLCRAHRDGLAGYCKQCQSAYRRELYPPKRKSLPLDVKTCGKCRETLPLDQFYKQANGWLGLRGRCKACFNSHSPEYIKRQRIGARQRAKERYDPDARRAVYLATSQASKERSVRWAKANPEKVREYSRRSARRARLADPEKHSRESKRRVEELSDTYIKSLLVDGLPLSAKDIPQALVEAKREDVRLHRMLKSENPK